MNKEGETMDKKTVVPNRHSNKNQTLKGAVKASVIREQGGVTLKIDPSDNLNNDIPEITKEDILEKIESLKKSSGYDTVNEYNKAIATGKVKFYSRARLSMWERYERMLEENFKDEQ